LLREDRAAIELRLEIVRLHREQPVKARQSLVKASGRHKRMGVMGARGEVVRLLLERFVQERNGFLILTLLCLEVTQHVQGRKAGTVGPQYLAVEIFRLRQFAGTMGRNALFEQQTQIHRDLYISQQPADGTLLQFDMLRIPYGMDGVAHRREHHTSLAEIIGPSGG
jgi:hypothetical protein